MRARILSTAILVSFGVYTNGAFSATEANSLATVLRTAGTPVPGERFRVLASPSLERFSARPSVKSARTCIRNRWFDVPTVTIGGSIKFTPDGQLINWARLDAFKALERLVYEPQPIDSNAATFENPTNGPAPMPHLDSIDRFISLLKQRFKLVESSDNAVGCNQVIP